MQKASEFFTQDQQAQVEAAIADAESKTSCEFVTVMASASGRYDRAEDIAGLWLGGIFLLIAWLKWPIEQVADGSWSASSNTLHYAGWLAILAIGFVIGAVAAAKLGKLRMLFTPRQEKLEEVESKAKMAFFDQRMHSTDGGTGVLIYISLFEQMVTILTDETVQSHVNDDEVAKHCAVVSASLAKASPEGLVSTIQALGESLATPLPCAVDDVDELDNAIVFVD